VKRILAIVLSAVFATAFGIVAPQAQAENLEDWRPTTSLSVKAIDSHPVASASQEDPSASVWEWAKIKRAWFPSVSAPNRALLSSALQVRYDNGRATHWRTYHAIDCQAKSGGVYRRHSCTYHADQMGLVLGHVVDVVEFNPRTASDPKGIRLLPGGFGSGLSQTFSLVCGSTYQTFVGFDNLGNNGDRWERVGSVRTDVWQAPRC